MHKIELDFEQAKTRHLLFKTKLKSILYGAEIDEQPILSHIDCSVGQWIYGHALKEYGHFPEMHKLERVHTDIHDSAKKIIHLYHSGNIDEARNGLKNVEAIADDLVSLLQIIEQKVKQSNHSPSYDADEKLVINYKELLELHQTIRELDERIKMQTAEFFEAKKIYERKLHNHFSQAPIPICIFRGNDFTFEFVNELFLELIDKKIDIIGSDLFAVIPELKNQGVYEILQSVIQTGNAYLGNEMEFSLLRNNLLEIGYFNFTIKPLEEEYDNSTGLMLVCTDVTAQVLSKETIAENQRRLNIAIESAALGTYEFNIKTDNIIFSDRYLEIFGFSKQHHPLHADMVDRIHPEDIKIRNEAHLIAKETGILSYEVRTIWEDKSIHFIKIMGKMFFDGLGLPEKIMGTIMDITEIKHSEEKIKKANETLEIAMQSGNLGSYELNLETGEANFNHTAKTHFGFDVSQEVRIDDLRNTTHPEDRDEMRNHLQLTLANKENYISTYRIITQNNEIRWIATSGKGVYDANGNLIKLVGVIEEITDRKKSEEELTLSLEKFKLLADSMPQFVWTGDPEGNLNYFNQSVFDYTGLSPEKVYAEGWLQIVHPDDRAENIEKWIHSVQTGEDFLYEHRFQKHTGEYRWQLSRAIAQRNTVGEIQMWVGTSTDIQDQKTMAQYLEGLVLERTKELKTANIELESINQELRSFTYISSHDLQEPLRKIQTFVSRIQDSDSSNLSKEGVNYFNKIQKSAHQMKTLINDLLTYSKTNATEKIFEKTNLNLLLKEIKSEFIDALTEKKGLLEILLLPEINAIPFQLRQLFINLISNSIKFSKSDTPPMISISASLILGKDTENSNAHENELYHLIIVKDNGIGFNLEYKTKIFEVFQRLHPKTEYEGTGIGLSICTKIAQNHNGFISAHSEINKGATFKIYLPVTN
jgi:PAS domain S-box-containing protein